jgi:hypothetical protein
MKDLAIYTAITGGYDSVKEHVNLPGDLFIFTDREVRSDKYYVLPCLNLFKSNNRNAKIHKVLAHVYFPEYEYTLWIDGNVRIKKDISSLINRLKNHDISLFKHSERTCAYKEAKVCSHYILDKPPIISKQVERYKKEQFPEQYGLWCGGIIFRSNRMHNLNEFWWKEICAGSKRDQISLPYALWKNNITANNIDGNMIDGCFELHSHLRLPTIN